MIAIRRSIDQGVAAEVAAFLRDVEPVEPGLPLEQRFAALVRYQRALHDAGLAVPGWPERLGGRGASIATSVAISRALGEAGAPEVINFVATEVLAPCLRAHGSDAELGRWLPAMASADEIWCQLFSEPDAGSDLAGLRTTARPAGDGTWCVSGQKVWSTWAQFAQWGLLLARTGPAELRHRGISAFVVDMSLPGISTVPIRSMTGDAEFAAVFLDDVVLPRSALLGPEGGGWAVANLALGAERGTYAVRRAAVISGATARLVRLASHLELNGGERGAVVQAVVDLCLLDLQIEEVVRMISEGSDPAALSPLVKQRMTIAEQSSSSAALRLHRLGAVAWPTGPRPVVVDEYLYSRAASIYGGTTQIQQNLIAERLLGLPR